MHELSIKNKCFFKINLIMFPFHLVFPFKKKINIYAQKRALSMRLLLIFFLIQNFI